MNVNFDRIKDIEQTQKDIVYGFIRGAQQLLPNEENSYYNIPSLVIFTCLAYYYNTEYFSKYGEAIELNDEKDTISNETWSGYTAYGQIDIFDGECAKFEWEFYVINLDDYIAIGIDSSNKGYTEQEFHDCDNKNAYYAYESDSPYGLIYSYQKSHSPPKIQEMYGNYLLEKGDTIKMELNVVDKTLKFYINDKDQGIAFKHIDFTDNKRYNMAVMLTKSKVKLINFQQTYST